VVMGEIGIDLFAHQPVDLGGVRLQDFGLIVALSSEAWEQVRGADADGGPEVEYWPVSDPTAGEGSREMRLDAYRQTRRDLEARITERFGPPPEWE